jgi:hypothetical protein
MENIAIEKINKKVKINSYFTKETKISLNKIKLTKCSGSLAIELEGKVSYYKEEKVIERNPAGLKCKKNKKIPVKNIPVKIRGYINFIYPIKLIGTEKLINMVIENIKISFDNYYNYDTEAKIKEIQELYPSAYAFSLIGKNYKLSNYEYQRGHYIKNIYDVYFLEIDSYSLEKELTQEIKKIFKENLSDEIFSSITVYEDRLFIDTKKILEKIKYPLKLIGYFNMNEDMTDLFSPESLQWDFNKNEICFERYFETEQFHLIGFTFSEKEICQLEKKDIMTPEKFLKENGIGVNQSTDISLLAIKTMYNIIIEKFKEFAKEDIESLKKILSS